MLDDFPPYCVECHDQLAPIDQRSMAAVGMVASRRNVESHRQEGAMSKANRRRYFTEAELTKLISAARKGRYG